MRPLIRTLLPGAVIILAAACGSRTELLPFHNPNATCATFDAVAQPAPLDVFLLMDSSGSMMFETEHGVVKWSALRDALATFLLDTESEGIGVGMTFFPHIQPNIPDWCIDPNACGDPAACVETRICYPSGEYCETDQDCADLGWPTDTCIPVGTCDQQISEFCAPSVGLGCTSGASCQHLGYCDNRSSCDLSDYLEPAIPVSTLPAAAASLVGAMDMRTLEGSTTTLPAIQGTLSAALVWAEANPSHKVIAVIATDGMPTRCDPALDDHDMSLAIEHIASPASDALARGVQTFVVGVFAPDEQDVANANLGRIAEAGGTSTAFVINTSESVGDRFLDALNEIRWSATSCELSLPTLDLPSGGFPRGSMRATAGKTTVDAPFAGEFGCTDDGRGWAYDIDTTLGLTPSRIILCPTTCDELDVDRDQPVEIVVDCST